MIIIKAFWNNLSTKQKQILTIYLLLTFLIIVVAICVAIFIDINGLFFLFALSGIIFGVVKTIKNNYNQD